MGRGTKFKGGRLCDRGDSYESELVKGLYGHTSTFFFSPSSRVRRTLCSRSPCLRSRRDRTNHPGRCLHSYPCSSTSATAHQTSFSRRLLFSVPLCLNDQQAAARMPSSSNVPQYGPFLTCSLLLPTSYQGLVIHTPVQQYRSPDHRPLPGHRHNSDLATRRVTRRHPFIELP